MRSIPRWLTWQAKPGSTQRIATGTPEVSFPSSLKIPAVLELGRLRTAGLLLREGVGREYFQPVSFPRRVKSAARPFADQRHLFVRWWPLLVVLNASVALAQPSAIVEDLQQRALAAIHRLARPDRWDEVLKSRTLIRFRIEQALNLGRPLSVAPGTAFLYAPGTPASRAPAVILVRPHQDPAAAESRRLPAAIAQTGILVLELDAHARHSRFDLLAGGFLPQSLIQRDLRDAIRYLKARSDVDATRLAIVGEGFAATVAAAINSDFAAAVLLDGAPDFESVIGDLRSTAPDQLPDSCNLLPGILQYAATQELLSLIAPRPLLLINAADQPRNYAADVYRSAGNPERMSHSSENGWTTAARSATYTWLGQWLDVKPDMSNLRQPDVLPDRVRVQLTTLPIPAASGTATVTEESLTSFLGAPLPPGPMAYSLNCRGDQRVDFQPQSGIRTPVTVLRPGPDACGEARGTLIAVHDRGRASLLADGIVQEAIKRGWVVWTLDPRGIGDLKTSAEPFVFALSLLLGENLTWRQAAEILRVARHVGGAGSRYPTALYARGVNMSIAASYVAAIADRRALEWVVIRDSISTFREISGVAPSVIPFGILNFFDIADIQRAAKGTLFVITDPDEFLGREW